MMRAAVLIRIVIYCVYTTEASRLPISIDRRLEAVTPVSKVSSTTSAASVRPSNCGSNDLCPQSDGQRQTDRFGSTYTIACNYNFDDGDPHLAETQNGTFEACLEDCSLYNNGLFSQHQSDPDEECVGVNYYEHGPVYENATCYLKGSSAGGFRDYHCVDSAFLVSDVGSLSSVASSASISSTGRISLSSLVSSGSSSLTSVASSVTIPEAPPSMTLTTRSSSTLDIDPTAPSTASALYAGSSTAREIVSSVHLNPTSSTTSSSIFSAGPGSLTDHKSNTISSTASPLETNATSNHASSLVSSTKSNRATLNLTSSATQGTTSTNKSSDNMRLRSSETPCNPGNLPSTLSGNIVTLPSLTIIAPTSISNSTVGAYSAAKIGSNEGFCSVRQSVMSDNASVIISSTYHAVDIDTNFITVSSSTSPTRISSLQPQDALVDTLADSRVMAPYQTPSMASATSTVKDSSIPPSLENNSLQSMSVSHTSDAILADSRVLDVDGVSTISGHAARSSVEEVTSSISRGQFEGPSRVLHDSQSGITHPSDHSTISSRSPSSDTQVLASELHHSADDLSNISAAIDAAGDPRYHPMSTPSHVDTFSGTASFTGKSHHQDINSLGQSSASISSTSPLPEPTTTALPFRGMVFEVASVDRKKRQLAGIRYVDNQGSMTTDCPSAASFDFMDGKLYNVLGGLLGATQGASFDVFAPHAYRDINTTFIIIGNLLYFENPEFANGAADLRLLADQLIFVFDGQVPPGAERVQLAMSSCPDMPSVESSSLSSASSENEQKLGSPASTNTTTSILESPIVLSSITEKIAIIPTSSTSASSDVAGPSVIVYTRYLIISVCQHCSISCTGSLSRGTTMMATSTCNRPSHEVNTRGGYPANDGYLTATTVRQFCNPTLTGDSTATSPTTILGDFDHNDTMRSIAKYATGNTFSTSPRQNLESGEAPLNLSALRTAFPTPLTVPAVIMDPFTSVSGLESTGCSGDRGNRVQDSVRPGAILPLGEGAVDGLNTSSGQNTLVAGPRMVETSTQAIAKGLPSDRQGQVTPNSMSIIAPTKPPLATATTYNSKFTPPQASSSLSMGHSKSATNENEALVKQNDVDASIPRATVIPPIDQAKTTNRIIQNSPGVLPASFTCLAGIVESSMLAASLTALAALFM